ncbi:hypothetical protein F0562_033602 [Nyssa sinensis]|uniref:DYW domain-containing protein n=1 Tax=Nyssa sinensis TaxID=561372 RepID=A0A5J5AEB2_9ASTE|nr:hypothetical protein F0562_033602 [Nyssa sinensis]
MRELKQIHAQIIKEDNFSPHQTPVELSKLVSFCAISPHGSLAYAKTIFSQEQNPSVSLCNSLIRGLSSSKQPLEALSLYQKILRSGLQPNNLTFPFVIKACTKSSVTQYGILIHTHVIKCGFEYDSYIQCSLIHLYANGKNLPAAKQLFDMCSERDVVSWNSMIDGYAKSGDMESARTVFDRMVIRDEISWNTMINGYGILGRIDEAKSLFDEMPERNVISWNSMLAGYVKSGNVEDALKLFRKMPCRDVVSWNAMLACYAQSGKSNEALDLFDEMQATGIKPTEATVVSLLSACAHLGALDQGLCLHSYISDHKIEINHIVGTALGMIEECWRLLACMSSTYRIDPKIEHYGCVIDLLSRAGQLEEAMDLIGTMPVDANASAWGALLGGCRIHGNAEVGERVGKHLINLQPQHSGRYVLLSNIYAAAKQWDDARKVRNLMKAKGVAKVPGVSVIELKGVVHRFVAGDWSHPESNHIYEKLSEISTRLKTTIGYSPDKEQVLLDIEEEEKEHALSVHSEKLAIAYGLLHLGPGEAVRIVKNLRVCRDCHYVTKLISRTYGREIIVRDRNRFHHFKDGGCSCLDFW